MKTSYNIIVVVIVTLAGCGGGGGSSSSGPVISTLTFPLKNGIENSVTSGATTYFVTSGDCSGTVKIVDLPPVAATFEGNAGQSASTTTQMEFTDCIPLISSNTTVNYYDSNLVLLGSMSGSDYGLFVTTPAIPVGVKVGDIGTIGTQTLYADNTKAVLVGLEVISYVVEPDTANSAIINLINKSYDSSGVLTFTRQNRYRIIADGTLSPISTDLQRSSGSTLHLLLTVVAPLATPVSASWGAPELVSNDLFDATTSNQYQFAGDNSGNMFLVTSYWSLNSTHVAATAYQKQAGMGWGAQFNLSPVKTVTAPGVSNFKDTQVHFDGSGNAVAAWVDFNYSDPSDRNFTSNVYVRNYDKVNGWGSPILIQSNPAEYATAVNLTVQDDGTAWIVWTERTFKDTYSFTLDKSALFAAKYTPLSGWSAPEKVTGDYLHPTNGAMGPPPGSLAGRIATDNSGNPMILWIYEPTASNDALYSTRRTAGAWEAPTVVAPAEPNIGGIVHYITYIDIAMDGGGNAIAVWARFDPTGTINGVYSNRYDALTGWSSVTTIPSITSQHSFSPALAMDPLGNAFILWFEYDGSNAYGIWAARFDHVLGWQTPTIISSSPNGFGEDSAYPQIGFDDLGNAVAIWLKYDAYLNSNVVRACRYDRNTGWGINKTISNGAGAVMRPLLSVAGNGHASAVWAQDDVGNLSYKIWSNDFVP